MASNVIRVSILADAKRFKSGFREAETGLESFKRKAGLAAKAIALAFAFQAARGVKDFVGDSVRAFSDLNESLNALEVTYGQHADGIKKLGREAAQNLGLSNAEFNSFAVSIANFAKEIAGEGGDVVGVVDEMTTRITDFASVMNLDVTEAQQKFQSGLAGQSKPLREFGIDVSAAKVEAFALANGIGEAGRELTEGEKVTARYGTIMEQTANVQGDFANTADDYANAQRIANAEMENAKARTGELLVPFAQLTSQVKELGAKALSLLSTEILNLTGSMSDADEAIQRFEIHTGQSADTAAAAITIVKDYKGSIDELIPRLNLSRDELEKLTGADEDFLRQLGFTEDQIDELANVSHRELASALTDSEQRTRDAFAANQEYEGGLEDVEEQIEETTSALERHIEIMQESHDQLRAQIDPLFALRDAQRDVEEAQNAVNEAIEEHGEGSPEHIEALENQTDAFLDLEQANIDVKAAGDLTREEFVNQQVALGHTREAAELLADEFENLESFKFSPKFIPLSAKMSRSDRALFGAAGMRSHEGTRRVPGTRGQEVPAILQAGERVLSATEANRLDKGGGGGGPTFQITVNAGMGANGAKIGKEVVEAIKEYERINGKRWRT